MNVTCTQCQMAIPIEDSRVPSSPFSIKCPRCRETVTVRPPPKDEPTLASRGMPQVPPGAHAGTQDAMTLLSQLLASAVAGRAQADAPGSWSRRQVLFCHNDKATQGKIRDALDDTYELHVAETAIGALSQLRETKDEIIVLDPQFDQAKQGGVTLLQHVNSLTPNYRRRLYLVLVSPQLKTLDTYLAFINGVNLTINTEDLGQFRQVLERSIRDFNELYHPFNQAAGLAPF